MARPGAIRLFELLYLASTAAWLAIQAGRWKENVSEMADMAGPEWAGLIEGGLLVLCVAITGAFWFYIARSGSNYARWIYAVVTTLGLFWLYYMTVVGEIAFDPLTAPFDAACAFTVVLLFAPSAKQWFRKA